MIELAIKYTEELDMMFRYIKGDDKFMYVPEVPARYKYSADRCDFVSVDSNGKMLGFISYQITKDNKAKKFIAINFSNDITFGIDIFTIIDNIFCKQNCRKLEFSVFVGNPIEKSYDSMINEYGGYIVGTRRKHKKLSNGEYCDNKMYELLRGDYINNRPRRFK